MPEKVLSRNVRTLIRSYAKISPAAIAVDSDGWISHSPEYCGRVLSSASQREAYPIENPLFIV